MQQMSLAMDLIEKMRAVVEAPGYKLLQHYKSDFYDHDLPSMRYFGENDRYLWVVREMGSDLCRLGVHDKMNEHAFAVVNTSKTHSVAPEIYLVTKQGLQQLSASRAIDVIKVRQYNVINNAVFEAGNAALLAAFSAEIESITGDANKYVNVVYQTNRLQRLGLSELTALRSIAIGEAVSMTSSLFVKVKSISINGQDLCNLIESLVADSVTESAT